REEMATGDLGDARLNARRNCVMTALEQSPDVGFPEACADGSETEALYRFLRNRRVSLATIMAPHLEATGARCRALDEVLVIHDTTEMSFPGTQTRTGLTRLGPQRQGFWFHTALAVSADGLRAPLGLVAMAPFARPVTDGPKLPWRERFRDPRKESRRWADGVAAVRSRIGEPQRAIHVMDREGDSYELLAALTAHGDRCVVRVRYDRQVVAPATAAPTRLTDLRAGAPVRVQQDVTVAARRAEDRAQRLAHPAREGRVATVSFAACHVVLQRPRDHRSSSLPPTVALNVVFGWEAEPPSGETPVEWWLVTTEPIDTIEDVLQIVEWYRTRWLIEEFFKCLKTGCAYEQRQLESFDTLLVALALLAPIAWQLLLMRHLARNLPETTATVALTARQIALLRCTSAGRALVTAPSVADALRVVARLGGHLRQNGEPGWLVLTRGMKKLRDMEEGWAAAERARTM
ncbi:MAG: IS4 family transposase, partial [Vicinamibacterales bacterium]